MLEIPMKYTLKRKIGSGSFGDVYAGIVRAYYRNRL